MTERMRIGRYVMFDAFAAGGMGNVHFGRLVGEAGFEKTVVIKSLHAHLALQPEFVTRFVDEARIAAAIGHPNVVRTLDVVVQDESVFVVLEYVEGESLAQLIRREGDTQVPVAVAVRIASDILLGLHAAHTARSTQGEPLHIVHRDVSPDNVMVGTDGLSRVLDFGIAKATSSRVDTASGEIRGKLRYMAPEILMGDRATHQSDVYSATVVLFELLTGRRLIDAETEGRAMMQILQLPRVPPSKHRPELPPALDDVVLRGLSTDLAHRHADARAMIDALEKALPPAGTHHVSDWLRAVAGPDLEARQRRVETLGQAPVESGKFISATPQIIEPTRVLRTETHSVPPKAPSGPAYDDTSLASLPVNVPVPVPVLASPPFPAPAPAPAPARSPFLLPALIAIIALAAVTAILSLQHDSPGPPRSPTPLAQSARALDAPDLPLREPGAPSTSPPSATPSAPAQQPAPSPRPTTPQPRPNVTRCNPPYTVDSAGIRRVKRECL